MSRTSSVGRRVPALLLWLVAAACRKDQANGDSTAALADTLSAPPAVAVVPPPTPGGPVTLAVSARPGEAVHLTDASGRAVYYLASPDGKAMVECVGECATAFDPVTGKAVVAAGDTALKVALIGEIARPDGRTQVTYGGKPLFYHKGDQAPGDTKGEGMKTSGGEASLVRPDGTRASRERK